MSFIARQASQVRCHKRRHTYNSERIACKFNFLKHDHKVVITGNLTSVICHTSNAIRDTSQITLHSPHIKRHRPRVIRHVTSNDMEPRYCCVSLLPSNTPLTNAAAAAAAAASSFFTRSCSKLPLPNLDLRCWLLPMHCESASVKRHASHVNRQK